MANEFDWLDELPDYGSEQVLENEQEHAEKTAPAPLPIPQMAGPTPEQRREELNAFLLSGRYEDAAVHERLKQNPELEDLSANVRRLDALNARAVQGQTVLRYAFPELGQEPGAYFLKRNKPLPECQTRTDAFAAVYDDYMAEVEGEYKQLLERRAAWQANKAVVSQAAADVVAGRVSPAALAERLSPEQHAVYTKEFDPVATEKAGVAMGMLRDAFSGSAEEGLKQMVDQGLANGVVAALSDADEAGNLLLNEKAVGMFQGALFSLMKEAKEKSGDEYKFLHNMLLALGNPVRRRKKDIQGVLGMMVQADTAAALAMAGDDAASQAVQHELGENIEEMRTRWKNDAVYARMRGMLDAAQAQGNETAEAADFFAKTVNALGSVIGQTAPFFVPYVGTWVAMAEAYDEKKNAAYFKGLKEGTAEWSAFIDAATSVTVEKIAFGGWARFSASARLLEKIPGYGKVRNTLLGSFYARAALEVGAGVLEESALEPTAEALLQWGLRNVFLRWADVGGKYDWSEYAAELKQMFKPEQLAATVIFGAGLSGVQAPMIKAAAEGYSKHVEHLMAQGIGKETARNIAAMPDAGERVDAAIKARAEAWKDPQAAEANRLMAATMFREIEEARALYESRAYQEARRELNLPKVEKVIDKEGRYLVTTFDRADGHELFHGEVGEQQLLEMLGHYIQHEERMRIHRAQSAMGANALLRAAEKSGEVVVEDMADAKNPESGEQVISEAGAMGLEEFKYAAELALDEMEARMASGMSEQEALATPFAALSRYMPLGHWLQLERAFRERLDTARETTGEEGADSTRVLNVTPAAGTTKADTLLLAARGQVETREVLEDVIEHAQKKVTGNDPAKLRAWHALLRDAQKAVKQLGFKLNFYDGHDGLDAAALQGKITEGMSKLASAYTVVNADALPLPAWVKDLVKWHMRALEDAAAIVELAEAYKTGRERGNISQDIEDVLAEIGHKAASLFQSAELEAVDVQAYKDARARYRMLTGDMTPTASEVQAEQDAADAREQERVRPAEDVKSVLPPREDGSMDEQTFSPAGDLPEEVRAAFPKGACYNIGARAWLGMVPVARLHLSPDAPQVKVGSNKKGVVNPLVGDYRQDAPPVYVWQRRNGALEVISGRHRLDLAKRTNTEMIAAYVYPEDAAHDAKWARLLDYEQNMQDDQADELTAAIYVRETQLSDEELTRRGLTRGGTKSARGILIGREAREDLWSRFQSRVVDPRMAEAICRLTMHMPDASRIDAMQAMAAADLAKGKSLEHVAAKLQLMAHADADGEATQGLLSFGESFDEALERSAEFIARSIEVINKHIAAVTKARSLGKGGVSEQEGISVGLDMDPKQRLAELNDLKAAYEKCGFHEKIRFRALTWDGKSDVDPIGDYARDKAEEAALNGPTAEELEQQARDEAAEATGTFGFATYTTRQLSRAYATDAAGNKLDADTFITTPNGNLDWYIFPQDDKTQKLLASRRIKNLPIRLTVGKQPNQTHRGFGLIHMLNHFDDYVKVGETPLLHLYNTLSNLVKIRGGALGRYNFKGEYEGKDSKLVAQLLEEDGYYSIITSYPEQMNRRPQAGELVIGRVLFQFPSNSGKNQIHVSKSQSNAVTASVSTNGQASAGNVAQSPAQVNIYDVRIRDSSGNLIFQQPVEAKANFSVTRNLAAVHSIPLDTMLQVEKTLGGLAKPSIAITRLDKPYSWGGTPDRVYLVGSPELADPQKGNLVYDRDAWTGKGPFLMESGGAYDYRKGEYFEPTLEAFVSRTIKKKGMEEGSDLRAQSAVQISTMEAVKLHREKLSDTEESTEQKIKTNEALDSLIVDVVNLNKKGLNYEEVAYILAKVCWRSSPLEDGAPSIREVSRDQAKRILNEMGIRVKDIKKPLVDKFVKAVGGLKNELEDYLESVPQRAVMFNEFEYAVMPESAKGTSGLNEMLQRNGIKPIYHDGTEEGRKAALAGLVNDARVSFSVVGEKAANWDKIKNLAFRGRDDGKLRVELDTSQAKLKKAPLHRLDDSLVREVERRLAFFRDELEKQKRWEIVSKLWAAGEYDLRTYDEMSFLRRVLHGAGIEFWNIPQMAELGVCALALDGDAAKRLLKVVDMPGVEGFNRLGEVLNFPELYEAYPELKKLPVRWMDDSFRYKGSYLTGGRFAEPCIFAKLKRTDGGKLSTLLHEVQHWIQHREGFAYGTVPGGAQAFLRRAGHPAAEEDNLYTRFAGEIEARNVQARRWMSADERAELPFNETLEHPGRAISYSLDEIMAVGFSVTSMSEAAQGLLEGSAMKVTRAADLIKDFNAQIANWNRVAASKEGRTDARTGAEMFGTVQALLSSARKVLPDGYRGNVHTLMQWASVYAGMAETGQLPAAGALKGNSKILDAFRKKMLNETAMAADNAEAEAMLASIGEQKLNEVMVKVLQQVRGQLAKFAKDELWAKMGKVIQHAKAKEEQGKKSKRGKMSAVDYEKLAKYEQYLAMDAETVREELDGMQGKLSNADADRAAVLEAEMAELSLYGGWKGMSLQQAVAAYQAMVLFCATGRSNWQRVLDKRKAEIEWLAREMGRALPTDRTASETRLAEHTKLRKALRRLPYGAMSYSQLMLALSSRLGEGFCFDRIQEMTDANAALLNAEKARMGWMYGLVQQVSGRKGELACEKWLADFDTPHDTGIVLSPMAWCEVEMTVESAEAWLALGKEEREKQWAEREADEKRLKRNLRRERPMVPEALLPELRKAVKEYKKNPRKSSGKVSVRGEYEDKGLARTLTCSRDGALYAILLHEQSDYQTVFGRPGEVMEAGLLYREGLNTPEKIRQLYDYVGPAGLRYGYALREKLHEQGLTVAQVFEAREGIPFKFRDNYFRASFDRLAVQDKNPLTDSKVNGVGGGKYGMLINRVSHHQEAAKWDMGASMVFLAASLEQDNYIFTSHITDRWRKLLLQREFATKLKAYLGDDVMKKLVAWLDVIDGAPLDNMSAFMNLSHWQGFFTGAWAASVLNGNGYVLMKQASALLHGYAAGYVPEAIKEQEDGVREVAHRHIGFLEFLGNAVAGGPISDKDLENSPYFQARRTPVGKAVATQGHMDAGRKRSALALPSEKLGEQIEKLDAWLNRKTARALANAFYAASKKLNEQHGGLLTEEQLREGALQAVGRMLELGAQPQTRTQKGIFQNGSGMLGKMTFAMKSESINKLGLMSAQAVRGERVSPVAAWVSFGLVNAAISFLISYLQGDDDELGTHLASAGTSTLTGPLSAVPVLGEGIAALASLITGERVYSSNLASQILDVQGIAAGAKRLYRHHADERALTWEQYFQTITGLLRASGAGFGAFSRSGSEALSSFGSLALSAAAGANVSRAGKDILCTVGLLDRPKKKGSAKSRTKTKAGQRTKRKK